MPSPYTNSGVPLVGLSSVQFVLLMVTFLCWILALGIACWGSFTEAGRTERARRRELAAEGDPGPTPGIDGFLARWGLWSLSLLGLGLVLFAWVADLGRV